MDTTSVWRATATSPSTPLARGGVSCEILIIGGGITGLTAALFLAQQGRKVVVLEADEFGAGSTGNSTGNLYATVSDGLTGIRSKWGDDVLREVVASRAQAVDPKSAVLRVLLGFGQQQRAACVMSPPRNRGRCELRSRCVDDIRAHQKIMERLEGPAIEEVEIDD